MKYKHGFIGNSSSASYYVRRTKVVTRVVNNYYIRHAAHGTGNGTLMYKTGTEKTDNAELEATGYATDGFYSWHPHNTAYMRASTTIPVTLGEQTDVQGTQPPLTNGVDEISFRVYGLIRRDHAAAGVSSETEFNADAFKTGAITRSMNCLYTLDTTGAHQLTPNGQWRIDLTSTHPNLTLDDSQSTNDPGNWFAGSIIWDGTRLSIYCAFHAPSHSSTTSCAIGISKFRVKQGESPAAV